MGRPFRCEPRDGAIELFLGVVPMRTALVPGWISTVDPFVRRPSESRYILREGAWINAAARSGPASNSRR